MPLLFTRAWSRAGRRRLLLLAVLALAATVLAVAPAAASSSGAPSAAVAGVGQQVTLVTGDVVTLTTQPGGPQEASVWRANPDGPSGQFQMFKLGSDLYVVPQSAVPYLGATLDLSLFDVTKLAASTPASTNSTVQITYRSAASARTVPGIRITADSGTSARGVVTPATGPKFGAALAKQWLADHASPTHTTGLFGTVARMSATPARTPASTSSAQAGFVMRTLTVNGRNQKGQKDTGDSVLVYNVDDLRAFNGSATFRKGIAKLSVPEGHYAAFTFFFDFATGTVRLAALPQFTVSSDMSITMDARKATSPVTITTSRPATAAINAVGIGRDDALGKNQPFTFLGGGTNSFFAQPTTQPVTVGQFHYFVYTRRFAPDGSYSYDLDFPSDGVIPADQHYVADDSTVAAVDTSYPAGHPDQHSLDSRFGAAPWQDSVIAANLEFVTPTQRVEYYSARPDVIWSGLDFTVFNPNPFTLLGTLQSVWRSYSPGTSLTTSWGGQPEHPRLLEGDIFRDETVCPACLSGSRLDLLSFPYSDNSPEHYGFPDSSPPSGVTESLNYSVSADGSVVRSGGFLDAEVTLPTAQQYRIDYHTVRSSADFPLSTDVQTSWTVPSGVTLGALPDGWVCTDRANPPSSCGVLPLVIASYDLPVDLLGTLQPGATTGTLQLGHLGGTEATFTSVTAEVSFDSGQTWQPAAVTDAGSGQFGVAFTVPASGTDGFGALRISTQDALGTTFDQTIQHAFAVGS